jgi:hypothetical protein
MESGHDMLGVGGLTAGVFNKQQGNAGTPCPEATRRRAPNRCRAKVAGLEHGAPQAGDFCANSEQLCRSRPAAWNASPFGFGARAAGIPACFPEIESEWA